MGGGELGVRGRLLSVRASAAGAKRARGGQRGGVPLQCDRERDLPGHGEAVAADHLKRGGESYARGKGGPRSSLAPWDRRARVLGCTMVLGVGSAWLRAQTRTRTQVRTARRGAADASGKA
jgi:hypothetical protein